MMCCCNLYVSSSFRFIPPVADVLFQSPDGGETIDSVMVPFMLPLDPPLFVRDQPSEPTPQLPEDCQAWTSAVIIITFQQ